MKLKKEWSKYCFENKNSYCSSNRKKGVWRKKKDMKRNKRTTYKFNMVCVRTTITHIEENERKWNESCLLYIFYYWSQDDYLY